MCYEFKIDTHTSVLSPYQNQNSRTLATLCKQDTTTHEQQLISHMKHVKSGRSARQVTWLSSEILSVSCLSWAIWGHAAVIASATYVTFSVHVGNMTKPNRVGLCQMVIYQKLYAMLRGLWEGQIALLFGDYFVLLSRNKLSYAQNDNSSNCFLLISAADRVAETCLIVSVRMEKSQMYVQA